jgi:hypothetical protein
MASLIASMSYSKADERDGRPNPSKIPFDGNVYNNLASYRNAAQRYLRFRDGDDVHGDTARTPVAQVVKQAAKPQGKVTLEGDVPLAAVLQRARYASVAAAVADYAVFLNPETVAQCQGKALFPAIRDMSRRGRIIELPGGLRLMCDDNVIPTDCFLWAAGCTRGHDVQFNHIWTDAKNPDLYTALWNLCVTPAFLAKTTDGSNHPEVREALKYRAFELYGKYPLGKAEPTRPAGYDQLVWGPLPDAIRDLEAVLRKRLEARSKHRGAVAARELGWHFSGGQPDKTLGG